MTESLNTPPLNTYDQVPTLYWYLGNDRDVNCYQVVHRKGKRFLGYREDPEPEDLYRYNLRFITYATLDGLYDYTNR